MSSIKDARSILDQLRKKCSSIHTDRNMLLTGEPGMGKTEFALRYLKMHPRYETVERDVSPVVYTKLQFAASKDNFFQQVHSALGQPQGLVKPTGRALVDELKGNCEACQVEIIFLDNVQALIKNCSESFELSVSDWINDLIDELGIPIVLIGKPVILSFVKKNDELSSRLGYRCHFQLFTLKENFDDYKMFLKIASQKIQFDKSISFDVDNEKDKGELAYRIFAYTTGFIRPTVGLLSDVASLAIEEGKIANLKTFANVLKNRGYSDDDNYFSMPIKKLRLRELRENPLWKHQNFHNHDASLAPTYMDYKLDKNLEPLELT